jgi:hypothetical protein
MIQKQKIWLGIFLAMFILPEILWSPIINFIYSVFNKTINGYPQIWRGNFLFEYRFEFLYKTILIIQLISILSFIFIWLKNKNKLNNNLLFFLILFLSVLLALILLPIIYLVIFFNPSFP